MNADSHRQQKTISPQKSIRVLLKIVCAFLWLDFLFLSALICVHLRLIALSYPRSSVVDSQFTNRRSCTRIAKQIAMKVASTEDKPALIKGSGTPITGSKPTAMPTLMKI